MNILLTDNEKNHIKYKLNSIKYDNMGSDDYITNLRRIAYNILPDRVLNILEKQRGSIDPAPYMIIDNLPIDDHISGSPQFTQTGIQFKSGYISENLICMIGAILGEPYSIYFEGQELVNNLTPHVETSNQYTGLGSEVELDLHIENSALRFLGDFDYSPLGLLLLGVREHKDGGPCTNVADARVALSKLSADDIEILKDNNYVIRLPYRWRQAFTSSDDCTTPCPMISGDIGALRVNAVFYPDMVIALNERAKIALNNFYLALRSIMVKVNIVPGKLLYVDNRIALHSRDKFIACYDENNTAYRWIQRLFIMPNLWPLQMFSKIGARVFNPSSLYNNQ